jgi:hypothetical protein
VGAWARGLLVVVDDESEFNVGELNSFIYSKPHNFQDICLRREEYYHDARDSFSLRFDGSADGLHRPSASAGKKKPKKRSRVCWQLAQT